MERCQVEGCNGTLEITGRGKAICKRCGTRHRQLDTGWMPEHSSRVAGLT